MNAWNLPSETHGCCLLSLLQIGQECGITSGKWMVRTTPEDEVVVWAAVARAVYVQASWLSSVLWCMQSH